MSCIGSKEGCCHHPLFHAIQVLAVSSAASAFKLLADVPPVTMAAWRLQLTGLLLMPPAIVQYWQLSAGVRCSLLLKSPVSNGCPFLEKSNVSGPSHTGVSVCLHAAYAHDTLLQSSSSGRTRAPC